jgi:Phytanoyl-CoA dioxygenase (PhyH)
VKKHAILRAIPGFRPLIKRTERLEREQDKLQQKVAKLQVKLKAMNERVALFEQQSASPPTNPAQVATVFDSNLREPPASTPKEELETFAEIKISADILENPRFEKFPYAGPFPWLDQPDAEDHINAKLAAGSLSEQEAELCRLWSREGYLILDRAIEPNVLDEVWAAYESAIADGVITLQPESAGPGDPWPGRFLDPHLKVPALCRILRHPSLLRCVELLMERTPAPFQTITSHKGSQQREHSDSIHMTTYPIGYLSACWVAFEDIHPDSGPLVYYPGSHRLPYIFSRDVGIHEEDYRTSGSAAYHAKYEPRIQEILAQNQIQPSYFHARKGDVLFWHANLLHGGSPRRNLQYSRRAIVNHYFVEGAICYHDLSASNPKPYSGTCLVGTPS